MSQGNPPLGSCIPSCIEPQREAHGAVASAPWTATLPSPAFLPCVLNRRRAVPVSAGKQAGMFSGRNRPAVGQTLSPAGDSRAREPPKCWLQGGEPQGGSVAPYPRTPQNSPAPRHRCREG